MPKSQVDLMSVPFVKAAFAILHAMFVLAICSLTSMLGKDEQETLFDSLEKRDDISFIRGSSGSPYVHFFAAEAEYGAFYSMPMLAEILNLLPAEISTVSMP